MSAIFLSYRRDDSSGYAGRLFDHLADRFGRERIFMDIETLKPGTDFVAGIDRAIKSCGAVVVMIGPNWIQAEDREGRRRLDNPHDFIRIEITTALSGGVPVIPVLVQGASMPLERDLPEPLTPLCRLQACEISNNRWDFDVRRLADVLEPLVAGPGGGAAGTGPTVTVPVKAAGTAGTRGRKRRNQTVGRAIAIVALIVCATGVAWWFFQPTASPDREPSLVREPAPGPARISPVGDAVDATGPPPAKPASPVVVAEPAGGAAPPVAEPVALPTGPRPGDQRVPVPVVSPDPRDTEPAVVPAAPRGPSRETLRRHEIDALIDAAESDLAELRLTRPAGNNAFDRFRRVLELEPGNASARQGLVRIADRYRELVEGALERGALDNAQRHLNAAGTIDPGAGWLGSAQHEIDRRRASVAPPDADFGTVPPVEQMDHEACLADCDLAHRACRSEIDPRTEANCLRASEATCEQRYEDCMADPGKQFMGQVSVESECIGVHTRCRNSAAQRCAEVLPNAENRCDTALETCARDCRRP